MAGDFNRYSTSYGNAVVADATTGLAGNSFPDVDGDVYVTISDGNDGWYIGGKFNRVGALQRTGVAHIFPSGVPDGAFNADVVFADPANAVYALATNGTNLYVGGDLDTIGGQTTFSGVSVNAMMAVNGTTGAPASGYTQLEMQKTPGVAGNAAVYALAVDVYDGVVIAGGDFNDIDAGTTRNNIVAFDAGTGALSSFDPDVNGIVYALSVDDSLHDLYAGGSFTSVNGGTTRRHAAAFDSSGVVSGFNPNVQSDVYALALDEPNGLAYMGGAFTVVNGGSNRPRLAAVDSTTGLVSSGSFTGYTNFDVYSIALTDDGSTLYAVGPFSNENGGVGTTVGAAAWDTGTSLPTSFEQETQKETYFISLNDNDDAVLIGTYDAPGAPAGNQYRADNGGPVFGTAPVFHILANGTVDQVYLPMNGPIYALALSPDEATLYVGGDFDEIAPGTPRNNLAAFDTDTGLPLSFDPDVDDVVRSLAVSSDGSTLYAGGDFGMVNVGGGPGTPRNHLAAFATVDGDATAFDPDIDDSVLALALSSDDGTLYVGGTFVFVNGGTSRVAAAAFNTTTGTATGFDPDPDGNVRALALSGDGQTVYAGGDFTTVNDGGFTRNYAAAFDATDGAGTAFDPDADNTVYALAIGPDGIVYLGGEFDFLGATSHEYIAAVDPDTGSAEAGFDANLEGTTDAVYALAHGGTGNGLLAGGKFNQSFNDPSGDEVPYVATVNIAHYADSATPTPTPATPTPTPMSGGGHSSGGGGGYLPGFSPTPTPFPSSSPLPHGDPLNLGRNGLHEGDVIGARAAGDPDVYIVNEWGYKRLFLNPIIFSFYGHLGFALVHGIVPPVRDVFPTSGLFRNCEANDPKVYAVEVTGEDTGFLHHVNISGDAAVAQDPDFFHKVFCINNNEFNWYPKSPVPYTSLSQIPPYTRR